MAFGQCDEDRPWHPGATPALPQATVKMAFGQENRDIILLPLLPLVRNPVSAASTGGQRFHWWASHQWHAHQWHASILPGIMSYNQARSTAPSVSGACQLPSPG
jgi:hypothetical protein